jgi:hypothetical protein
LDYLLELFLLLSIHYLIDFNVLDDLVAIDVGTPRLFPLLGRRVYNVFEAEEMDHLEAFRGLEHVGVPDKLLVFGEPPPALHTGLVSVLLLDLTEISFFVKLLSSGSSIHMPTELSLLIFSRPMMVMMSVVVSVGVMTMAVVHVEIFMKSRSWLHEAAHSSLKTEPASLGNHKGLLLWDVEAVAIVDLRG